MIVVVSLWLVLRALQVRRCRARARHSAVSGVVTNFQKGLVAAGAVVVVGGDHRRLRALRPKPKGEEVYMAKAAVKDLASFVSATGRIEARTKVNVQSSVIGEIRRAPRQGRGRRQEGRPPGPDRSGAVPDGGRPSASRPYDMQKIAIEQAEVAPQELRAEVSRGTERCAATAAWSPRRRYELSRARLQPAERSIFESLKEQVAQAGGEPRAGRGTISRRRRSARRWTATVTKLNAEKGEITLTGTMNNPGTVIMVVSDMGEILATVDVDETRVTQVKLGQTARVVVDAVGEAKPYTGKVVEIAGSAIQRAGQQTAGLRGEGRARHGGCAAPSGDDREGARSRPSASTRRSRFRSRP